MQKNVRMMSDNDLNLMIRLCNEEIRQRALSKGDPDVLIQQVMDEGFTVTGDPIPPKDMGDGIVAITGVVKDTSTVKHRCTLYTIRPSIDDTEEYWMWQEDASTYIGSETVKVDKIRRTVTMHAPADGAVIIEHRMLWDGSRHERTNVKGYQVKHHHDEETGEIVSTSFEKPSLSIMRRLPPPPSSSI